MSMTYSCCLEMRQQTDFERVVRLATELTREWSLSQYGYDLTVKSPDRDDRYQGFDIYEEDRCVCWHDFSGIATQIPVNRFVRHITATLPDVPLRRTDAEEGQLCYKAVFQNGEWTELEDEYMDDDA